MSDNSKDDFGDETLDFGCLSSPEKSATERQTSMSYRSSDDTQNTATAQRAQMADVDPVRVLQLSQNVFVEDSMEEDEDASVMIPPTPMENTVPFIIPSTPTGTDCPDSDDDCATQAFLTEDKKEESPQKQLIFDIDDDDDDDWSKATQPILPNENVSDIAIDHGHNDNSNDETFADTEDMFASCIAMEAPQQSSTPVSRADPEQVNSPADDDDWNLRLSATQPTQSLETIALDISAGSAKETVFAVPKPSGPDDNVKLSEQDVDKSPPVQEDTKPPDVKKDEEIEETSPMEEEKVVEESHAEPETKHQDRHERESTPESVRLFAEIENIVKAARESEMKLASESANGAGKKETAEVTKEITVLEDSDDEAVAPSQTSIVSLSRSRKTKAALEEREPPILVPDTDATMMEESEGNHVDEVSADIPETENFVKDVIKASPTKTPAKKQSRLTKAQKKRETKKKAITDSTSDSADSLTVAKEITKQQAKTLNGNSEQNIAESLENIFRPPRSYSKKTQRTPQKIKPLGRLINDFSPNAEIKASDTTLVADTDARHSVFKQPKRVIGSFSDEKSLAKLLQSAGVEVEDEKLKSSASSSSVIEKDVVRIKLMYRIYLKEDKAFEEFTLLDEDVPSHGRTDISPMNSSSTTSQTTSSAKTSSFTSTQSGEMGDISSSMSLKSHSSNSSGATIDNRNTQESLMNFRTSTQIDATPVLFQKRSFNFFPGMDKMSSQDDFKNPVIILSPIKTDTKGIPKVSDSATASKLKRKKGGGRKAPNKKGAEAPVEPEPKRTKRKSVTVKEETSTSSDVPVKTSAKKGAKKAAVSTRKGGGRKGQKAKTVETTTESDSAPEEKPTPILAQPIPMEETGEDPAPFGSILPGVRVMARWKDGYYYPGLVQSKEPDGRWAVEFDDAAVRVMTQDSLLKIALLQVGTKVLAKSPDHYYDPGVVISHYRDEDDMGYVVEQVSGLTRRYKRGSVILSTEQAKLITNSRPSVPASLTINLDNIIGGKRKRKSSQHSDPSAPPSPPKIPRTRLRQKPDPNLDSTEASGNESAATKISLPVAKEEESSTIDSEAPAPPQKKSRAKGKKAAKKPSKKAAAKSSRKGKKTATNTSILSEDSSQASIDSKPAIIETITASPDVPVRSSKLFNGYAFLLTHAVRKNVDSTENKTAIDAPFDREYLCKIVTQSGGVVLDTFEDAQKCMSKKVILLANSHLRTIKYLQCVAANIPCIQQYWVQTCSSSHKIVDRGVYMLPSGYNIIEDKVMEWHGKTDIFKGLKIVITSEKKNEFVNIWTPVLLAAKAELVQKWNMPSFTIPGTSFSIDLIITNASCPTSILTAAKKGNIPVVSSEYVIQCIIAGEKLPYDGHLKFKHDFKE